MNYDYSRYYENWHEDTAEHFKSMIAYYKNLLEKILINIPKNVRILEIGSGMGFCLLALKEMGYNNIFGIDIDEMQTLKAKEKGLEIENISALDYFEKNSHLFDIVLMFDVLKHIEKKSIIPLLLKINTQLSTNGLLICQTPNCYSIAGSTFRYIDFTHEVSFSPYSLDFVLYNANFKDIQIQEQNKIPKFLWINLFIHPRSTIILLVRKFLRRLYQTMLSFEVGNLEGIPLSANIIAIARKK
jgi:SAM-dependent methyltransferase